MHRKRHRIFEPRYYALVKTATRTGGDRAGKWHYLASRAAGQSTVRSARVHQTSICSAVAKASSTSMPRYRTVLSTF
jgi:hypothetical protein